MVTGILGGGYSTIDARKSGKLTLGPFSNQGVAEGPPDTQTVQVEVEEEPVPHAQQKKKVSRDCHGESKHFPNIWGLKEHQERHV